MGMRIRKKWDLPSEQTAALAILAAAFLLGGIAGSVFVSVSSEAGAQELSGYLTGYLELAETEDLPRSLWQVLWGQLKFSLGALALGLTGLGVIGLPVLFGVRGFFFVFPVACFVRVFGGSGFFPAFLLLGLSALLWAPALFLIGVSGFLSAQRQLRRSMGEGRGEIPTGGAYWSRAGLCVGLSLAAGLLEFWVVPVLLRAGARIVL